MVSEGIGYLCAGIAVLGFGSNFVPVKRFETGDGMFYQWLMCSAIFIYAVVLQLFLFMQEHSDVPQYPANETVILLSAHPDKYSVKFYPFAMLGGALWATGNTMAVPVINFIGLSMGLLIWGSTNMVVGWATGHFGLFGVDKDAIEYEYLNYLGVGCVLIALAMYTFVKPNVKTDDAHDDRLLQLTTNAMDTVKPSGPAIGAGTKRAAGVILAMISGALYGSNFTPPFYMKDKGQGPTQMLNYVFSHFVGIYFTSTFWFIVYCFIMKSTPRLFPRVVLPSMLSGLGWAIAQTCWFVANDALGLSVCFPIVTSGPGAVGAIWGVFVFGEISGRRNYVILSLAILLTIGGCVMVGISKKQ